MVFFAVVHIEDIEQFSSWFLLLVFNKDNLLLRDCILIWRQHNPFLSLLRKNKKQTKESVFINSGV